MSEQLKASIVRIFFMNDEHAAVGVGFLVADKHILTCAHVVVQALGLRDSSSIPDVDLCLDFPFVAPDKLFKARVVSWQPRDEDDIAVLALERLPPVMVRPVRLVNAQDLWGHSFRAFGFPADYEKGVWATGVLRQEHTGRWVQLEAIHIPGHRIVQGFSGTPVWDEQLDGVVGMVVESDRQATTKAAYIIPTPVLLQSWPSLSQQTVPPCPYRGLFAFREIDEPYFFGREMYVAHLVEAVQKKPFTALIGPSGSGKTSVAFAGLVPRLSQSGSWVVAAFRPGQQPFYALATALIPLLEAEMSETDRLVEINKLAQLLQKGQLTLPEVVARIVQKRFGTQLLIIVDQFEELYTLGSSENERLQFLNLLLSISQQVAHQRSWSIHLIITLRADFFGHALSYRPFADALQDADLKLGPMTRQELRDAIYKPAEKLKVQVDENLIEHILWSVGEEPGHLPLLEFALTLLWERQREGRLTLAAYEEIGGVEASLAAYADEIVKSLSEAEQIQTQQIFIQLIRPGEGTEDTRRIATRTEIGEERWQLVPFLSDARLVVSGRDESTGNETAEIVHEALIRGWKRLREWMERDRAFRMWQERLRMRMSEWKRTNASQDDLLRGFALAEAETWSAERATELSQEEQNFICASREQQMQEEQRSKAIADREKLKLIFDNTPMVILALYDAQTAELILGSPRYTAIVARIHGLEWSQLAGLTWHELTFAVPEEEAADIWNKVLESHTPVRLPEIHYRFTQPEQETIWDWSLTPILDTEKSDTVRFLLLSLIDITEQVLARQATEQLQQNLQFLSEASKILSSSLEYRTTLQLITQLAVPHIADWFSVNMLAEDGSIEPLAIAHSDPQKVQWAREWNKKNLVNMNATSGITQIFRIVGPEFVPFISDDMLVTRAGDDEQLNLARNIDYTSVMTVPLILNGEVKGTLTFASAEANHRYTDVDLSMAQELASRVILALENARLYWEANQARDYLAIIMEGVANGIIAYDTHGHIVYANEAAAQMMGFASVVEMLATQATDISTRYEVIDEQGRPFPHSQFPHLRILAGELEAEAVMGYKTAITNRPERWTSVKSRPVFDEQGKVTMVITIVQDITERILAEQRKDEFFSLATHELRTPFTSVTGNVLLAQRRLKTLLASEGIPENVISGLNSVQAMLSGAERHLGVQNRLIRDLLDVVRIQANRLDLSVKHCDLVAIVRETVEDLIITSPTRHIILKLPGERTITVAVDADRISQVISNYIVNAFRYSAENLPVEVSIDEIDGVARVSVQDKGIGIPNEEQSRIWERFYTVPDSHPQSQRPYGVGLGLGLYICRTIIEQHQGHVGVQSSPGEGSTFWFSLPLACVVADGT